MISCLCFVIRICITQPIWIDAKISTGFGSGSKLPSIRAFAASHGVSVFTVVEAYDRLVAQGWLVSRANAGFFVRRFANMRWSILTPQGSLHWDGSVLEEGPPAQRGDAPQGDPTEDLWRKYYASIFNPARLKIGAMLKEMPRRYWKNMPETALIPELIAGAQAREAQKVKAGEQDIGQQPQSLAAIAEAILACRRCEIGCNGTGQLATIGVVSTHERNVPQRGRQLPLHE